ncbi:nuclear transport factor 2 family protein [Hydrogenophaga sp. RWCD_12]|uniref:nuclear transport factor 2 family protein n=1 Tax=Hydrogenophaga sp. RWCD_12 TaxID=3391190 RepID=UPI003984CB1B
MNASLMRRPLVALCLTLGVATTAWSADSPDTVFDRYVTAVHAGDMAAVRALIAPDVERSDFVGCRPEMDHPSCLAHYIEATVVRPKARLTVVGRRVDGDTVAVDLEVRSPLYTQAGAERIVGQDIVRVRNGLIHAFRFAPDFRDEPTAVFFATLGIGPRAARPSVKP